MAALLNLSSSTGGHSATGFHEEVAVVKVEVKSYVLAHGRRPRGIALYAFAEAGAYERGDATCTFWVTKPMYFADAVKLAKQHFAVKRGFARRVVVLP